jgi:sugar/nucleoside kinase (ribokinase family)
MRIVLIAVTNGDNQQMKNRVLAIGGVYVDINCRNVPFDGVMRAEEEYDGSEYEVIAGSSGVNFARICRSLGLAASFAGKVGDDRMGQLAAELLADAGIEPILVSDTAVSTQIAVNFMNNKGETVMPGAGNANQALGPEDVLHRVEPKLKDIDYLYLGTCLKLKRLLPAYATLAASAMKAGVKVVVDHGRVASTVSSDNVEAVKKLVVDADYYLPSTNEFLQVWGFDSIEQGLHKLNDDMKATVVIKDGANGCWSIHGGEILHIPAIAVEAVHLVGAGDSFNAGFIAARANGLDLPESMRYATAVAALKISGQKVSSESVKTLASSTA